MMRAQRRNWFEGFRLLALLTLVLAFNLFAAFVDRHSRLCRRHPWTRVEIARQLYRSLFLPSPPVLDSS